ncbi:MAG: hypothetical protein ACLTTP_05130 [Alistipes ihumii]
MHAYAVRLDDFLGITPKLLVRVDDTVKAGTPLFFDKYRPQVLFTSPVSGRVTAVNRGEKRRILDIVIAPEAEQSYEGVRCAVGRGGHEGERYLGAAFFGPLADDRSVPTES